LTRRGRDAKVRRRWRLPDRLNLPDGWQPEGITAGPRSDLYVGSIPTGAVLRLDARSGATATVVQLRRGRAAIGLKLDRRRRLFVAGGPTGKAFVYDARTGADLRELQLAAAGDADTFVNDVALTRRTAYFTDSRKSQIYAVDAKLGSPRTIALPDIPDLEGNNLNGIVATPREDALLAVQSNAGKLWKIDPATAKSVAVDLGGETLANGDGLLLKGRTLYVVQNRLNQIAVVRLNADYTAGSGHADLEHGLRRPDDDHVPARRALRGQRALRHDRSAAGEVLGHAGPPLSAARSARGPWQAS